MFVIYFELSGDRTHQRSEVRMSQDVAIVVEEEGVAMCSQLHEEQKTKNVFVHFFARELCCVIF